MSASQTPPLLECVPNFSEGRDAKIIAEITGAIEAVEGARLLHVDPGHSTNRCVVTFAGHPEAVVEAAFQAIARAAELIDMRRHHGAHPRIGATDVCPLVPISGISMAETVGYARRLAERVGRELDIPVYLYGEAATTPQRRSLAAIRRGEIEGLKRRIEQPKWRPDFGPAAWCLKAGATVIGARDFLVAYNVNLETASIEPAISVAETVRESGRFERQKGEWVRDPAGKRVRRRGTLRGVRAIGWTLAEYGIAQVSLNITDIAATPVHRAFEEVKNQAAAVGSRVTGSELVGLIPLSALLEAGRFYLAEQNLPMDLPEAEILLAAAQSLGLGDLAPFDPQKRVLEYRLRDTATRRLAQLDLRTFANITSSAAPVPGGGSTAAYVGTLASALGVMVGRLSAPRQDYNQAELERWADRGHSLQEAFLTLVDEDSLAFDKVLAAKRLPRKTREQRQARVAASNEAMQGAIETSLRIMERALEAQEIAAVMVRKGLAVAVADAGVGALCARAALRSAHLNLLANATGLDETGLDEAGDLEAKLRLAGDIAAEARRRERAILRVVEERRPG